MSNNQMTVVEYLLDKIAFMKTDKGIYTIPTITIEEMEKLKEMEKEQIELAYRTGWINYLPNTNAEEYYNATYGGQNHE